MSNNKNINFIINEISSEDINYMASNLNFNNKQENIKGWRSEKYILLFI